MRQSVQVGSKKRHYRYRSKRVVATLPRASATGATGRRVAHRKTLTDTPQNITVGDLSGLSGPALPSLPATSPETSTLPPPEMVASVPSVSNDSQRFERSRALQTARRVREL